jgi:hypothetical protein
MTRSTHMGGEGNDRCTCGDVRCGTGNFETSSLSGRMSMVRTLGKARGSIGFRIISRPDWVRHSIVRSKYDDAVDAALSLKDDKKVVHVLLGGMRFDSLSTALRIRISQKKLSNKIHVEQNKKTKQVAIVKGCSHFKGTGRPQTTKLPSNRSLKRQSH